MKLFPILPVAFFLSPALALAATHWGAEVPVGQGTARTYVETATGGAPVELGIALTPGALQGLPAHAMMTETVLPLPAGASIAPYTHAVLNWNPMGHEPPGIYDTPHFDFHFYALDRSIQAAITCAGDDHAVCLAPVDPSLVPADYVGGPEGVPTMGWHWVDPRSPEFNGQPFTSTYIYGYYGGRLTFVEPMVTRELLLSGRTFESSVRLPSRVSSAGYYPGGYSVFVAGDGTHRVALRDLRWLGDCVSLRVAEF